MLKVCYLYCFRENNETEEDNETMEDDETMDIETPKEEEDDDDDDLSQALAAADALGKAPKASRQEADNLVDGLKELNMDNYDDEDDGSIYILTPMPSGRNHDPLSPFLFFLFVNVKYYASIEVIFL